jgi:carbon monoxide dehydrogenase subunit G
VVACVPGAAITALRPDGTYEATIAVRFGPTIAKFSGEVTVSYDHAARRCNVEGRGIDQRGASRALVSLQVAVDGGEQTVLAVNGGFSVAGPLETFASAGGVHVARALLAEFAKNMAAVMEAKRATSPQSGAIAPEAAPAPVPAHAAPMRGDKLLWRAFLGWLRQLLLRR